MKEELAPTKQIIIVNDGKFACPRFVCRFCGCPIDLAITATLSWHPLHPTRTWICCEDCEDAEQEEEGHVNTIQLDHAVWLLERASGISTADTLKQVKPLLDSGMMQ